MYTSFRLELSTPPYNMHSIGSLSLYIWFVSMAIYVTWIILNTLGRATHNPACRRVRHEACKCCVYTKHPRLLVRTRLKIEDLAALSFQNEVYEDGDVTRASCAAMQESYIPHWTLQVTKVFWVPHGYVPLQWLD